MLARAAEGTPIDVDALLRDVGLPSGILADDDARVALATAQRAWELAGERSGDDNFGLNAAQRLGPPAFDLIEYLGRTASTAAEALSIVADYSRLITDATGVAVEREGFELCLRDQSPGAPRHFTELFFAVVVARLRDLGLPPGALLRVGFSYPRPASIHEQQKFFQAPVVYACGENVLAFAASAASHPLPTADEKLRALLERHARDVLARMPPAVDDMVARVHRMLEDDLASRRTIDIDEVAKRLAVSRRTMQRRLAERGTSFNEVLDDARRDTAIRLARERVAPSAIAFLLGFADPSAFHRAFKRWTGATPAKFGRS